jgi:hypothetical protein
MPTTRRAASRLLSASELQLFDASRRDSLAHLDERTLRSKVERTRKLRDKSRDLLQRQKLASRTRTGSKAGKSGEANARTQQKAELVGELLQRFEERLKAMAAGQPKPAAQQRRAARGKAPASAPEKPAATNRRKTPQAANSTAGTDKSLAAAAPRSPKPPKAPPQHAAANGHDGFVSPRAKVADTQRQVHLARGKAINAHVSSRNRRSQAKRDAR